MLNGNFAVFSHYIDGIGKYGERRTDLAGRPDGEGEYVWDKSNTKQGFEWFATTTVAKRAKDASDLRPYTLLSGWASFVPGVKSTDFVPEEGGHPVYGADNLSDPWSNPQIQRIQAAFNPIAAVDLPYWSASGESDQDGNFPLPEKVDTYSHNSTITRNITVFNDDLSGTSVGFNWTARLDRPDGTVIASGNDPLTIPLGSRVTRPISFTAPASGSRVYLVLSTTKSGSTTFTDSVEYLKLGNSSSNVDDAATAVTYNGSWSHASNESGPYAGTNSYSDTTGDTASLSFVGTGVTLRAVTAPSHGMVSVSIDGGAEALVDLYSAARTGDVSVWTSPRLTSGKHTIRVRVTGTKRDAATHDWATVDRFEIRQPTGGGHELPHRQPQQRQAARRGRWVDRGRRVDRPEDGWRRLDHRRRPRRRVHAELRQHRQGARRRRLQVDRRAPAAAVEVHRRHQPAVVPAIQRRRVLHHRQPRQRAGGGRVRLGLQRQRQGRAVHRRRRRQPAMAAGTGVIRSQPSPAA
jgi:hypothetical protein